MPDSLHTRVNKIDKRLQAVEAKLAGGSGGGNTNQLLNEILEKENQIMSKVDDLNTALGGIATNVENIAADATKQIKMIEDLKAIIAAGGTITEAQLQPALDLATSIEGRTKEVADLVPDDVP
jgi:translation initiation factor 1 (eIF-1/SUI1)